MLITIFTDGSYSDIHGIGAWACYIRADNICIKQSGIIPYPVDNSNICEFVAIANALEVLEQQVNIINCNILIKTDSMTSIGTIHSQTKKNQYIPIRIKILSALAKAKSYKFNFIKGHAYQAEHTKYGQNKYKAHRWCDLAARAELRQAVRKVEHDKAVAKEIKRIKKGKDEFRPQTRRYSHRVKGRGAGAYKRTRPQIEI